MARAARSWWYSAVAGLGASPAARVATHVALDDPSAVAELLDSRRAAGVDEETAVLAPGFLPQGSSVNSSRSTMLRSGSDSEGSLTGRPPSCGRGRARTDPVSAARQSGTMGEAVDPYDRALGHQGPYVLDGARFPGFTGACTRPHHPGARRDSMETIVRRDVGRVS